MFTPTLLAFFFSLGAVNADVYMHNPRGSNDRNCERNVNRNNGDRLFNSQNNNAGGYACERGVGDGNFMNEAKQFTWTDANTKETYTQNLKMYYYEGSILPIEFTNQHGCGGNSKINCEIILQYACEDTLDPYVANFFPWTAGKNSQAGQHYRSGANIAAPRDGVPTSSDDAATDTIGDNDNDATPNTAATRRYGMHENEDFYTFCRQTARNRGLYTADQQVNRNDKRGTRQNPNGNRNGLECPEERDYYPWWHPSPWIDIAVLTDSAQDSPAFYSQNAKVTARCNYYFQNTMNYNKKGYCDVNHATENVNKKLTNTAYNQNKFYNNKAECEENDFTWYEVSHADNLVLGQLFVCAKTQYSRVNQLGNAAGGVVLSSDANDNDVAHAQATKSVNANRFLWEIPRIPTYQAGKSDATYFPAGLESAYQSCVIRLRYNISTSDFQPWPKDAVEVGAARMVDWKNNSKANGNGGTDYSKTPVTQNPYVYIGPGRTSSSTEEFVRLKINTNQFGRTFQDRSYTFRIKKLPSKSDKDYAGYVDENLILDTPIVNNDAIISSVVTNKKKIYNLNVRGKRGNIVQVYPNVEYDYVPNQLALQVGDFVHFQWTGSDYNPRRGCNDGQGGPPDANTYNTEANANQNSRADRHNWMLTEFTAKSSPMDYLGYIYSDPNLTYDQKIAEQKQQLGTWQNDANGKPKYIVPCSMTQNPDAAEAIECYKQVVRLAYLNQQQDGMSLFLRENAQCLTRNQLKNIGNDDVADNHPLNCGKLNAKPTPYFDGGLMMMRAQGWFAYMDSRNNNFSNRGKQGVICVGSNCPVMNGTNVLQDKNPNTLGASLVVNTAVSDCKSTSTAPGQGVNGVQSCITSSGSVITVETFAGNEGDNDNKGDGNKGLGCTKLTYFSGIENSVEEQVVLAVVLLFVGLFIAWFAYFMYNRYQARYQGVSKFRFDATWQNTDKGELAASDPTSGGRLGVSAGAREKKNADMI